MKDGRFYYQIQALLEYGMYSYAFDKVKKFISEFNQEDIYQFGLLFEKFNQYQYTIDILNLYNIFDKQLDIPQNEQMNFFKLYYIGSLTKLEGTDSALKKTNQIFNDQARREIQHLIKQIQENNKIQIIVNQPQVSDNKKETQVQQKTNLQEQKHKKNIINHYLLIFIALLISFLVIKRKWVVSLLQIIWSFIKKIINI